MSVDHDRCDEAAEELFDEIVERISDWDTFNDEEKYHVLFELVDLIDTNLSPEYFQKNKSKD